jgi:protease-4
VIFQLINWDKAAEKLGIDDETLHAGQYKDIGSPWREMTPEERLSLDAMLKQVHEQFIKAVDAGRANLDEAAVRKLATGMIYNGEEAAKNGLVDGLGGLEDAKVKVRELAKLPKDAPIEEYGAGSIWEEFFGAAATGSLPHDALARLAAAYSARSMLEFGAGGGLQQLSQQLYLNTTLRDLVLR